MLRESDAWVDPFFNHISTHATDDHWKDPNWVRFVVQMTEAGGGTSHTQTIVKKVEDAYATLALPKRFKLIEALSPSKPQQRHMHQLLKELVESSPPSVTDDQLMLIDTIARSQSKIGQEATKWVQKWVINHPDRWAAVLHKIQDVTPNPSLNWPEHVFALKEKWSPQDSRRLQPLLNRLWIEGTKQPDIPPLQWIQQKGPLAMAVLAQAYTDNPKVWGQRITASLASLDLKENKQKQAFDNTLDIMKKTPALRSLIVPLLDHSPITQQGLQERMGIRDPKLNMQH
ncbi:hypothetical protein EBZ35_09210, partial [bacterium]|nr:hypothetical protein [bacterium]